MGLIVMLLKFVRRGVSYFRWRQRRRFKHLVKTGDAANIGRHWPEAARNYASALEINPLAGAIWVQYGHALKEQGYLQDAEKAYLQAVQLGWCLVDTYLQLGHSLKLQGKTADAINSYQKSHYLAPCPLGNRDKLDAIDDVSINNVALILNNDEGKKILLQVLVLYMVVLGRKPDQGGLFAYTTQIRKGVSLKTIASEFINGSEFISKVGKSNAKSVLYLNAFGSENEPDCIISDSLDEIVVEFVLNKSVGDRFNILSVVYGDGVPLNESLAYQIWLEETQNYEIIANENAVTLPVLSLVTVVDRPDLAWLQNTIASALAQSVPDIEILIVSREKFPDAIIRLSLIDARLRLIKAPFWYHMASLFNRALTACKGQFTSFIGQHDQLGRAVAAMVTLNAAADIIVADDDSLDEQGLRHSPRLGSAWDPDQVIATGRPGLILAQTALLRQINGMHWSHGQEEWDLLLRATAAVGPKASIAHVPLILLSRRGGPRPHGTRRIHRMAAKRYLSTVGHKHCSVRSEQGILRVVYPLPKVLPLVSIIIPARDRADLTRTCLTGLLQRTDYPTIEVVIVDNGTTEPDALALLQTLSRDPRVRVVPKPGPFNWSALNNAGVSQMRGELAILLNNDIDVIDPNWLGELVSQALRPEVGAVGAKLLYADRTIQHAGIVFGPAGRATHMWRHAGPDARGYLDQLIATRQVSAATGACLAIRREVYAACGGCDEELPVTWNDSDLCLRIRALGLHVIWTPYARLLHLEQATRGTDETPEGQARFARERDRVRARWNGAIDIDPFLNSNLFRSETQPEPHLAIH